MFVEGVAGPVPSLLGGTAFEPTGELVWLTWNLVEGWSDARIKALSLSYRNFDRVYGLGWLVADALGLQATGVIDQADAFTLGSAAYKRAKKIDTKITAVERCTS